MKVKPSESELEILQIMWEKGPLTVRKVNEILNESRRVGYTTTLKIMQIMAEKGMLDRDTGQRSHIYSPTLDPEEVQSGILEHVIRTVFNGQASKLVVSALGNHNTSADEMEEIKAMIESMQKKKDGTL